MFNDITIVAATKYADCLRMRRLFHEGITNFGENRVDSFLEKFEALKDLPITWHFIGTLQSNKAEFICNKIEYLHSLDSLKLAKELNKHLHQPLKCFIEVNVSREESKHGVFVENLEVFLEELKKYDKIQVIGFMTMAPHVEDESIIRSTFQGLRELKEKYHVPYLSMGMSHDYKIAIECGATHVRLGRILFEGDGK